MTEVCEDCGFTEFMHTEEGLDKIGFTDHEYAWKTMGVCKKFKPSDKPSKTTMEKKQCK